MLFTVAVCTWNRSALLEQTLQRLTELDVRDLDWELVVVDNGSTDETRAIARSLAERLPLRLVSEPLVGVSHARNAAVREARGTFIAWTGDDVLVDRGWLRAYADAVTAHRGAAFFGGPIRPRFACEPPEWLTINWRLLAGAYSERELGDTPFAFDRRRVPYSANFVVHTDTQRRYPFDPALGVRGPHRLGGEETTVIRAMLADGHEGWWIPDAAVEHFILGDRLTLEYIRRHFAALGMLKRLDEGSAHLPGCAPWVWRAAMDAERDYRVSRQTDRPEVWMPKFIAASVAKGRVIGPPPYVKQPLSSTVSPGPPAPADGGARGGRLGRRFPARGVGGQNLIPKIESPSTTLKRDDEITAALAQLDRLELPPHVDRPKNWDAFRAFSFVLGHGRKNQAVLDLGSSTYGVLLSWLHLYGWRDLHGCDRSFKESFERGSIRYEVQDLEHTTYPSARFDYVTCLSVIEHGVDLEAFFGEAARLLKVGGYLLVSTDFWCDPVLTSPRYDPVYRCPVRVFTASDVPTLVATAARHGLEAITPIDTRCDEAVVHWQRMRLRFTFLFLAFRRCPAAIDPRP